MCAERVGSSLRIGVWQSLRFLRLVDFCLWTAAKMMFLRPKVLGHRAHNLIRFKGTWRALDCQGDDGWERKVYYLTLLGVFTTVLLGCPNCRNG